MSEQSQQVRKILKLSNQRHEFPKSSEMIKVESLMNASDHKYIQQNSIGLIASEYDGKIFMVSKNHRMPSGTTLPRQDSGAATGEIVGMQAVTGG